MSLAAISVRKSSNFTAWSNEPAVSFEDDSVYDSLEPYFKKFAPTEKLDPYDGGTLNADCFQGFIRLLEDARADFLQNEETWIVRKERWNQGDQIYCRDIIADKKQVLNVIENLINLTAVASVSGNEIIFVGD